MLFVKLRGIKIFAQEFRQIILQTFCSSICLEPNVHEEGFPKNYEVLQIIILVLCYTE